MYADLKEVEYVAKLYPTYVERIGESEYGNPLYAFTTGEGGILVSAGMHAREHITTKVLLEVVKRTDVLSFPAISLVPLINPDGVEISIRGADKFSNREELKKFNEDKDFSLWKANARGVDLNVNFDADWGKGRRNVFRPSSENYVGEYPESEKESRAIADFARKGFLATISLHAKGEVIYYAYKNLDPDPALNAIISKACGYPLERSTGSAGGFKDWCVLKLGIPAYTVELGDDRKTYTELYEDIDDLANKTYALIKACKEYYYG